MTVKLDKKPVMELEASSPRLICHVCHITVFGFALLKHVYCRMNTGFAIAVSCMDIICQTL